MTSFKEKYLKKGNAPYFIAEIGINHNGRMDLAKEMIDLSKNAGADAVKFQKRDISLLVLPGVEIPKPTGYLSQSAEDIPSEEAKAFGTWTYPDSRLELSDDQYKELMTYCKSKDVEFIVSPWENNSVDFLAANGANIIKLASIDTNNYQFCEYIASKKIPTIISTGMTTYTELQQTWEIFHQADCPMMFLHCTSAYPSPVEDKHLSCIPVLKSMFGGDIGFSGHGTGFIGTLGAVALGANVIEKHVSPNRKMRGPDHAASLEFSEFKELIKLSNDMVKAIGNPRKRSLESEKVLHGVLSKRIVAAKPIKSGTKIEASAVFTAVTKQEGGLLPNRIYDVLGKTAAKDLPANHILELSDLN